MAVNKVEIKFEGNSDSLTKAISQLDNATKKLLATQSKIRDFNDRIEKSNNKYKNSLKKLRVQLQLQGKDLKDLKLPLKMYRDALGGNELALAKIKLATREHIKSLKRQKKGLLDTEHGTRILGGSFAVLRSKMLLASFGAGLFGASVGKLTNLFGIQEQAEKKLETAIGRHSRALLAFASAQQQVTTFGDEEIINAMSLVGAYTENEKAIARITQASMDLAQAKGMDLNSAVDLVSKSIFSSTNALSRYGIEVKGTTGSTERLEVAVKNISDLYGGQAKASTETFLGSMKDLSDAVGDTGEAFGAVLAPAVIIGAKGIQAFAENIDEERIKAYGTAIIGMGVAHLLVSGAISKAVRALILFTKASKKNIAILVGTVAVGALIDKFNLFADETGNLSEELKELEGALGGLSSKGQGGAFVFDELNLANAKYADTLKKLTPLAIRDNQNHEKMKQLRESLNLSYGATTEQFKEMIGSNKEQQKQYIELETERLELERAIAKERVKIALDSANAVIGAFSGVTSEYKKELTSRENAELESLRKSDKFKNASREEQKAMEETVTDKFADEKLKIFKMEKTANIASIITNTASAVTEALPNIPLSVLIAGLGAIQLKTAMAVKPPQFETGGLVGGRRHSQGGTMIEAEQGEFVMSRNAVQAIGVETLNQMNQGGGAGLTVNVSAPLVDETVIDSIIPAIQKAQRMNLA